VLIEEPVIANNRFADVGRVCEPDLESGGYTMKELEPVLEMLRFDQPPD